MATLPSASARRKITPVHALPRPAAPPPRPRLSITQIVNDAGAISHEEVGRILNMSKAQLAETVGLSAQVFQKASRRDGPKAQSRMREMVEIIALVQDWAGSPAQAMAWYRAEPIPAFGGRTAEALVKSGAAGAVRDYIDHLATGGYA